MHQIDPYTAIVLMALGAISVLVICVLAIANWGLKRTINKLEQKIAWHDGLACAKLAEANNKEKR